MRIFLSIREHIHIEIRRKYIWNSKRVNLRQTASIRSFTIFNLACTAPKIELEYSYLSFLLVLLVCHKQKPSLLFLSSFYCSFSILIWGKKIIREKNSVVYHTHYHYYYYILTSLFVSITDNIIKILSPHPTLQEIVGGDAMLWKQCGSCLQENTFQVCRCPVLS